ncbi:MAG TPA: transketolase, partial [Candidatus Aerophobetes bacterium]|nr:transketolase [Candidatus Aerophobetes bacterium]
VMSPEPIKEKWLSFGWHTVEIDGHNIPEILDAFSQAKQVKGKPTIIIAHTTKGKGVSFMENVVEFHGKAPSKEEAKKALEELREEVRQWEN